MAKGKEVAKSAGTAVANTTVPEYLQQYAGDLGLGALTDFIRPPRAKIVQALSKKEYKTVAGVGSILTVPDMTVLSRCAENAEHGEPVHFTPVFFYGEWCVWNPAGVEPTIFDRSLDKNSDVAKKAKRFYTEDIKEAPGKKRKWCEHLNFIVLFHMEALRDIPCLISFSKGSYKSGEALCAKVRARRTPIWSQNYALFGQFATNSSNQEYYQFGVSNPVEGVCEPHASEADCPMLLDLHKRLVEAHAGGKIVADYDDDEAGAAAEGAEQFS